MKKRNYTIKKRLALPILAIAMLVALLHTSLVSAGGAIGSGGSATGGSGGYQSTDGYGWYIYSATSNGPSAGFRDGTSWASIQSACAAYSTQIAVFVIRSHDGKNYKGYNYPNWNNSTYYLTSSGFVSAATAKAGFDALDSSLKTGFTWGSNVGWYCYGTKPPPPPPPPPSSGWVISGESTVSTTTAKPGQTVTFNHKIRNTGTSTSPTQIKSRVLFQKNGGHIDPVWELPYDTTRYAYHNGGYYAANSTQDEPGNLSFTIPTYAVNGDKYCEATNFYPKSSTSGAYEEGTGNWACVEVLYAWEITGRSTVEVNPAVAGSTPKTGTVFVKPGDELEFVHYVENAGPDVTDGGGIQAWTVVTGGLGGALASKSLGQMSPGSAGEEKVKTDSFRVPVDARNGVKYCQYVAFSPTSSTNSHSGAGADACAEVKFDYALTPVVNISNKVVQIGQDFTFSYDVKNSAASYWSNPFTWSIDQTITTPTAPTSTSSNISSGSSTGITGSSWSPRGTDTVPGSYAVGTVICRKLTIKPPTNNPTPAKASMEKCILIAAAPYVHVVGGTVWSGGSTASGTSFQGARPSTFGSFGEYGLFATQGVNMFGSGGQLWAPTGSSGMDNGTRLTFANTPSFGTFTLTHAVTDQVARYASAVHSSSVLDTLSGHVQNSGVYKASGDLMLNSNGAAWAIPAGKHAVIYAPNNTVTIAGDITYSTGGVGSFADLPSLTVIAKTILVKGAVQQIAGYFYVTDRFASCSEAKPVTADTGALTTTGACSKQLIVNGSVAVASTATNSLVLNRSYGGTAPGQPAELFRMRPESFLTPYEASATTSSSTVLTTVQESELPSRY